MTASTIPYDQVSTNAFRRWARTSDRIGPLVRLAFGTAVASLLCVSAWAADGCGGLKVPGYTALRTVGPLRFQVNVSTDKEREEDLLRAGIVRITDLRTLEFHIMNTKTKTVTTIKPPPKLSAQSLGDVKPYMDKEPAEDGMVKVTAGFNTPKGKEWLDQTKCRPDGIFVERKTRTPGGTVITVEQKDIVVGPVTASQFDVPSDYKVTQPPPPKK